MSRNNRNNNSPKVVEDKANVEEPVELEEELEETGEDVIIEKTSEPVKQPEPRPIKEEVKQPKPAETAPPMNDLLLFLTQYQEKLLTLKHDEDVAKVQLSFYKKIINILSKESYEEARVGLNTILKHIHQNRDKGLNEINLFRGAANWQESPQEYATFRRLLWIFLETADPQTRKTVGSRVTITSLEKSLTSTQYSNLISFYG